MFMMDNLSCLFSVTPIIDSQSNTYLLLLTAEWSAMCLV